MTVSTEVRSVEYDGDDSTTSFPIPFELLKASHLRVTYYPATGAAVVLTEGADPGYVVSPSLTTIESVACFGPGVPLKIGETLVVERVVPVTQEIDLTNQGTFDAETHEEAFDLGVMVDQQLLDRVKALESAGAPGSVLAGNGLEFAGDLVTLHVVPNADGSIVAAANDVKVGVLATDAQHGVRGGGTQHLVATGASAGFQSATDKTRADALWNRTITAGNGLSGGGDLSANRTIDITPADGTLLVTPSDIRVGVIGEANHGTLAGDTLHAEASTTVAGFMSPADKTKLDGLIARDELENSYDLDPTCATSDATQTTILAWTPDDESAEHFEAQIVGVTSDGLAAAYKIVGAGYRHLSTTALISAVVVTASELVTTTAWDATIDASSPQLRVRVTGAVGVSIKWSVIVRRRRIAW